MLTHTCKHAHTIAVLLRRFFHHLSPSPPLPSSPPLLPLSSSLPLPPLPSRGQEVVLSAGPVKAVVSTLLQARDKQTLLLALTVAKELVSQKNKHTAHLLRDPLEQLVTHSERCVGM